MFNLKIACRITPRFVAQSGLLLTLLLLVMGYVAAWQSYWTESDSDADSLLFPRLEYHRNLNQEGGAWRITCTSPRGRHVGTASLAFFLILPVGLVITRLCFIVLRQRAYFREELEAKVREQTFLLSRGKQEWERTFDSVPDMIMLLDQDLRITRVNRAQAAHLGISLEELIGKPCSFACYGSESPPDGCPYTHLLRDGEAHRVEACLPGINGHFLITITPLHDEAGNHVGSVRVSTDVTDLKEARQKVEEEKRFLYSLMDTIPDLVFYKDREGIYLGCNEAFAQGFLGRGKSEIIGKDDSTLFNKSELAPWFRKKDLEVLSANQPRVNEEWVTLSDGREILLETIKAPFHDETGIPVGIIGISRDVTARQKLEHDLILSRSHMQTILDNLPMLAWLKDDDGRFLMVNHQLAENVGRPRDEILGLTALDVWPEEMANFYDTIDKEIMATGSSCQLEEQIVGVGGTAWYEAFKAPILSPEGRVIGTTGIARDITKRKQKEQMIQNYQSELEELNAFLEMRVAEEILRSRAKELTLMHQEKLASIGVLAAGVAHEINTPLGFVSSNIQIIARHFTTMSRYLTALEELLARETTAEQRREVALLAQQLDMVYLLKDTPELIAESMDGVNQVARIVRELKRFSRVDTPEYEETDLIDCLESTLSVLTHELKNVALERKYGTLPSIPCHPGELNHLFANLLMNACQAVSPPGRITLRSWHDDTFAYVEIADNGHGIPAELREKIFEPFFTTREVGQGTGLGLSVSRDIVAKHRGELLLESNVGVGTTVTVKLPLVEDTAKRTDGMTREMD